MPIFKDWLSEQHIFRLIKSCKELTGRSDVSLDKEKNDQNSESLKTEKISSRFEPRGGGGGTEGSILASKPAAPGLILGVPPKNCLRFFMSLGFIDVGA